MNSEVKSEFKDFIGNLSHEVCIKIIEEDMKALNDPFNKLRKDYLNILDDYKSYMNTIHKYSDSLEKSSECLGNTIDKVTENTRQIDKGLAVIHGEHKEVLDKISEDISKTLIQHKEKLNNLSKEENEMFAKELSRQINEASDTYIKQLAETMNFIELCDNTSKIIEDIDTLQTENEKNAEEIEKLIKEEIDNFNDSIKKYIAQENAKTNKENTDTLIKEIKTSAKQIESEIKIKSNELNKKLEDIEIKLNSRKYIIIMNIVIIMLLLIANIR